MPETSIYSRDIRSTILDNGVKVITETMPHVRSVAVGVWIGTGASSESPEVNGISHFIEHMVFQGTEKYSAEQIARSVDSLGGNLDAFTSKELVSFNTKVLDEHLPQAFDVLAELVLRPLFRDEDIAKEKGVILEEIKMENDSPEYLVHELFCRRFWPDHPLGRPILGTPETVESLNRDMLRNYFLTIYSPSNILITAAGNLRHEALLDLARAEFEPAPATENLPVSGAPTATAHIQFEDKDSLEQVHVCLGAPAYPVDHELRYACYVLNTLLGGGMSSRLFQNIREKRGLAYSVYSDLSLYRDCGCLLVSAGTSADSAAEVVRLSLEEFRALKSHPVPEDELRRTKDQLKGSLMLSLESTGSRMSNLARQQLYFGRFHGLDEILSSIEAVTVDDLQQVATRFLPTGQAGADSPGQPERASDHRFGLLELDPLPQRLS